MQIGKLRHRIKFQTKQYSKASTGQDEHTWVDMSPVVERSASIKPFKGTEVVEARGEFNELLVSIMLRYDPEVAAITASERIVRLDESPARVYAIQAIINHNEGDRWLEFWCSEGIKDVI